MQISSDNHCHHHQQCGVIAMNIRTLSVVSAMAATLMLASCITYTNNVKVGEFTYDGKVYDVHRVGNSPDLLNPRTKIALVAKDKDPLALGGVNIIHNCKSSELEKCRGEFGAALERMKVRSMSDAASGGSY